MLIGNRIRPKREEVLVWRFEARENVLGTGEAADWPAGWLGKRRGTASADVGPGIWLDGQGLNSIGACAVTTWGSCDGFYGFDVVCMIL